MADSRNFVRIASTGLTYKELNNLQAFLESSDAVARVRFDPPPLEPGPDGKFQIQASAAAHLGLFVILATPFSVAATKTLSATGEAFGKKIGEAVGELVSEWLKAKLSGKTTVEVHVVISDRSGKTLKRLKAKR